MKINGKQHYLWRPVDQDGEVVDVYLQARPDGTAAKRFFRRLLRSYGGEPGKIVTNKLQHYGIGHRELIPETIHSTQKYENNRTGQSHEAMTVDNLGWGEIGAYGGGILRGSATPNLDKFAQQGTKLLNFNVEPHYSAGICRLFRDRAFSKWAEVRCVQNTGIAA